MKLNKIVHLFPTPLLVYDLNRSLTPEEIGYLHTHCHDDNTRYNFGNIGSKNTRILDSRELQGLHADLTNILVDAFKHIYEPMTPVEPYITQSWLNLTHKNQHHHMHIHPNSILSAVLYLKTSYGDKIVLHRDSRHDIIFIEPKNLTDISSDAYDQMVEDNMVVVFPSKLLHLVPPVTHDDVRISLSLNSFIRGEVGSRNDLNSLIL